MSVTAVHDEEKYINGCRLSSSLLELQPFKVVTAEAKSMTDKDSGPKRPSYNNNNRHKDRRTYSSPGLNDAKAESKNAADSNSEVPLLADNSTDEQNKHGNSVSCDNLFDGSALQVTEIPDNSTPKKTPNRSVSVEYGTAVTHGNSLPMPIIRSPSKEMLIVNESPNHVPTEQKKTKPKKPNRESLRRSRPDIRASHPNLPASNRASIPPNGSSELNLTVPSVNLIPGHDYEELPTDAKILQNRQRVSQLQPETTPVHQVSVPDVGFSPSTFQSQPSPAVPERSKNPRQRLNPLYAGMHVNPYEQQTPNGNSTQKRPPTRCLHCLIAGAVIAIILSILSSAAISLMLLGYLEPIKGLEQAKSIESQDRLIADLQNEILLLKNISNHADTTINNRLMQTKFELVEAVKSLNLSALKGPETADIARCTHKFFGIGSSSSQNEISSGEYFPEKGYVTTGVTCSAPTGYVAYLDVNEEEYYDDGDELSQRLVYKCICRKSSLLKLPSLGERVACYIHYWQCPVL